MDSALEKQRMEGSCRGKTKDKTKDLEIKDKNVLALELPLLNSAKLILRSRF